MGTALDVDRIEDLSILQNRNRSRVNVTNVNGIVACDDDIAAAWRGPRLDELSIFIKNGDTLVVAIGNEQSALRINGDSVRQLKLAGSVTLDAADDFDELSILRELHHA